MTEDVKKRIADTRAFFDMYKEEAEAIKKLIEKHSSKKNKNKYELKKDKFFNSDLWVLQNNFHKRRMELRKNMRNKRNDLNQKDK